jgi:hypothetical protein
MLRSKVKLFFLSNVPILTSACVHLSGGYRDSIFLIIHGNLNICELYFNHFNHSFLTVQHLPSMIELVIASIACGLLFLVASCVVVCYRTR